SMLGARGHPSRRSALRAELLRMTVVFVARALPDQIQIASEREEKVKSFTSRVGAAHSESSISPPRVRSLGPSASTLASTATGLSLNRKLLAGPTTRPFSM